MKRVALSLLVVAASGAYVWKERGLTAPEDFVSPVEASTTELHTGSIGTQAAAAVSIPPAVKTPAAPRTAAVVPPAVDPPATGPSTDSGPAPAEGNAPWERAGDEGERGTSLAEMLSSDEASQDPSPRSPAPTKLADLVATPAPAAAPADATPLAGTSQPPTVPAAPDPALQPPIVAARLPRPRPEYHAPAPSPVASRMVASAGVRIASNARYADGVFTGPIVDAYYGNVQVEAIVRGGQLADVRFLRHPGSRRASIYINRRAMPRLRREAIRSQDASVDFVSGATLTSEAFRRSLGGALRQART